MPVLDAIVRRTDQGQSAVRPNEIEQDTGFDTKTVERALRALASEEQDLFLEVAWGFGGGAPTVFGATGHARRLAGAWPTADVLADRLIQTMKDMADAEEDEEKASRLKRTAAWFGTTARDILVQALAKGVTGQIG
ncbi:hypothetical protein STSO111631_20085 [Stackebrandtia soli]